MRIFVSEYVCGGAWPEKSLDSSLVVEGRAMLVALVSDLLSLPDVEVVTTWDDRLGEFPLRSVSTLSVDQISSRHDERQVFERLCEQFDAAFVIAPEFHNILAERVEIASARTRLLGCDVEATTLCSDKLRLATFLDEAGVSTISTEAFEPSSQPDSVENGDSVFPCVIKPRDGAGSLLTFKASDCDELDGLSKRLQADGKGFSFIRQPFIEGVTISCAAIVMAGQGGDSERLRIDVLPPCQQILADDGSFTYEGAEYPPPITAAAKAQVERLVRHCCSLIPGLSGYVGFDLLVPHAANAEPIIVEINPRLTTGFMHWQKMCNDNLVARMLAPIDDAPTIESPLSWKSAPTAIRMSLLPN